MDFQDILSSQGVTEKQFLIIKKEMTKNRIFLTREEKIEERYQKLKLKCEEQKSRLRKSAVLLQDLKSLVKEKDSALSALSARESLASRLQREYEALAADRIISSAVRRRLSDTRYPELLYAKLDRSKLSINSTGAVEGIGEQLASMRSAYPELFCERDREDAKGAFHGIKNNSVQENRSVMGGIGIQHDQ